MRLGQVKRLVIKIGSALPMCAEGAIRRGWIKRPAADMDACRRTGQELPIASSSPIEVGRWPPKPGEDAPKPGLVPVINENDTVSTVETRYGDNDWLAARVAMMARANLLVLFSDIDGPYTGDPRKGPGAAHLAEPPRVTPEIEAMVSDAVLDISTGGIITKMDAAKIAVANVVIAKGNDGRITPDEGFLTEVNSAIAMCNASTRFAGGGMFGMGAEIGISPGQMHARGPRGAEQLTSVERRVRGAAQTLP